MSIEDGRISRRQLGACKSCVVSYQGMLSPLCCFSSTIMVRFPGNIILIVVETHDKHDFQLLSGKFGTAVVLGIGTSVVIKMTTRHKARLGGRLSAVRWVTPNLR